MASTAPRPLKVEHEFTDVRLTGFGGWSALALTAERLGLFGNLAEGVSVKVRRRGASDGESLWALVASLAAGGGALSDLDALRADPAARRLLGLRHAPSGRRMGEFLAKGSEADLDGLLEAAWRLAGRVASVVIEHGVAARGWVPVFVDGTEIVGCGRPGGCIRAGSTRRTAGGANGVGRGSAAARGDARLGSGGQRPLRLAPRGVLPQEKVGLLGQRHAPQLQGPGAGAAGRPAGVRLGGRRPLRGGGAGAPQAGWMGRAPLRRGPQVPRGRPRGPLSRPHGHPRLPGRPRRLRSWCAATEASRARRTPSRGRCGTWTRTTRPAASS